MPPEPLREAFAALARRQRELAKADALTAPAKRDTDNVTGPQRFRITCTVPDAKERLRSVLRSVREERDA